MELSDIQGLVLRAYRRLPRAQYVLLRFEDDAAAVKTWLGALWPHIDSATPKDVGPPGSPGVRVNVAFTSTGLDKLGLEEDTRQTFPLTFLDGLGNPWPTTAPDRRSRILGDVDGSAPQQWDWGYKGSKDKEVDALLLVFATDDRALGTEVDRWIGTAVKIGAIAAGSARILSGEFPEDPNAPTREAFGFVDGVSQPVLMGATEQLRKNRPLQPATHEVDDGEFLLGHRDGSRRMSPSPTVRADCDPHGLLRAAYDAPQRHDLGYNGTYLVFRQLAQDTTAFASFCADDTRRAGIPEERFKALLVGRWPNGSPVETCPIAHDETLMHRPPAANDFRYGDDPHGERCPIGAHIRRTNPRDSIGDNKTESWQIANRHRILRRGRPYRNGAEEGLHFICLNAEIDRQFEFIQQNWINEPAFDGLSGEDDPLVGARQGHAADGRMTLPPAAEGSLGRAITGLPRFVTVKGGAYLFLPSLTALRYLAECPRIADRPRAWAPLATTATLGNRVRFLVLARCPLALIAGLSLLPLSLLSAPGLVALVRNMFIVNKAWEMAIVSAAASLTAAVALITFRLVQLYSKKRFDVPAPGPTALTWRRMLRWQAASLPLICTMVCMSIADAARGDLPHSFLARAQMLWTWDAVRFGTAAAGGYLVAFMLLTLAEAIRDLGLRPDNLEETLLVPPAPWLTWLRLKPSLASKLPGVQVLEALASHVLAQRPPFAEGYVDRKRGRILPGHLANTALALTMAVVYVIGWCYPPLPPHAVRLPSMTYVLFVLTATAWLAAGTAFFLDRLRVPFTLILAAWLALAWISKSSDHVFPVGDELGSAPTAVEVLERADAYRQPSIDPSQPAPIIVVAIGGGGIHQAAWTARVLTGLTELWGHRFADNLRLVSGASAGSVGAMYFVNAYTSQSSPGADLQRIVDAAKSPALSEIWWGLTYPDLLRALLPAVPTRLLPATYDRAWAMEQAWQHTLDLPPGTAPPTLGSWANDVRAGWRPAVAFNVTMVETGERVTLASYQMPPALNGQARPGSDQERPIELAAITAGRDVSVVTAARLSAAFPLVTPAARPANASSDRMFHLVDGGYWDNSAIVTALEWLESVRQSASGRQVLFIEIPPQPEPARKALNRSWVWQLFAPITALLTVRSNGQGVRGDLEVGMFKDLWQRDQTGPPIVSARIPYDGPDAELSWQLSRREGCDVERAWREDRGTLRRDELARIASVLGPPDDVPSELPKECN